MALAHHRAGDIVMHINYSRGESREFVYRRRASGNRWSEKSIFKRNSEYNRRHRRMNKWKLHNNAVSNWENYSPVLLREADDIWNWD